MATITYARCSTAEQTQDRQLDVLDGAGCAALCEKISGATRWLPQREALLGRVREGDSTMIAEMSHLERSTRDVLGIVEGLRSRRVHLKTLDLGVDTSSTDAGARPDRHGGPRRARARDHARPRQPRVVRLLEGVGFTCRS